MLLISCFERLGAKSEWRAWLGLKAWAHPAEPVLSALSLFMEALLLKGETSRMVLNVHGPV